MRLRRALWRFGLWQRPRHRVGKPVDEVWHEMLARLDIQESERRLAAAEMALNRLR